MYNLLSIALMDCIPQLVNKGKNKNQKLNPTYSLRLFALFRAISLLKRISPLSHIVIF